MHIYTERETRTQFKQNKSSKNRKETGKEDGNSFLALKPVISPKVLGDDRQPSIDSTSMASQMAEQPGSDYPRRIQGSEGVH